MCAPSHPRHCPEAQENEFAAFSREFRLPATPQCAAPRLCVLKRTGEPGNEAHGPSITRSRLPVQGPDGMHAMRATAGTSRGWANGCQKRRDYRVPAIVRLSGLAVLELALLAGTAFSQQKSLKDQLVGSWTLVSDGSRSSAVAAL